MPEGFDLSQDEKDFSFDALAKKLERRLGGQSEDSTADGVVKELDNEDIISQTRGSHTAVICFYRNGCPFCEKVTPILDELADDYKSRVSFSKVNINLFSKVQNEFKIMGVPLIIILKKGMIVGRIEGLRSHEEYDQWIDSIHKGIRPMGMDQGPMTRI